MVQQENTFKVAEVQVTYKPKFKALERPKITTSEQLTACSYQDGIREKLNF